ncbi:MAG: sigma-54-dependent Fis family transcriptional regulator [Deltaproteobacteria bacterium]|nr:sigma-54-dependent Fis family transcriptional regulator [Deltaproteobacteria bacterium]
MRVKKNLLLIEDDEELSSYISLYLQSKDYPVSIAYNSKEALKLIQNHEFDLVLLDIQLPDGDGIDLIRHIKNKNPLLPIIVTSSFAEVQTVVRALKRGASDYIQKPVDIEKLAEKIQDLLEIKNKDAAKDAGSSFQDIEGPFQKSEVMGYLWKQIAGVIHSDVPLMIYGETGTGKTFLAKKIHEYSHRNKAPFVHVNCPSIPEHLIESEIFGHNKGAFTGADKEVEGKLEFAEGGSVFLDEIGDISMSFQAKLLRVLESREFEKLGSNKTIKANIRFLAATNKNLEEAIRLSHFREDLYYRLNVYPLYLPPLRERKEEILSLAEIYLQKLSHQFNKSILLLSAEALRKMQEYNWPGNIRELENVLQRAFHAARGVELNAEDIVLLKKNETVKKTRAALTSLKELEHQKLLDAIQASGGSITRMANILGVGRDTVYRRLAKYGIDYKK